MNNISFKIDRLSAEQLSIYLERSIFSDVKSIDAPKEYMLARHVESVLFKLKILLLKYKRQAVYKLKSLSVNELEVLALNIYFTRYQLHSYLLPIEQVIMEAIRTAYPQLINVLNNNIQWIEDFSEELQGESPEF